MKKLISLILLCTMMLPVCFGASKKEKSKYIKLDAKKKFAIEGVALGSDNWPEAKLTKKGEVIWNHSIDNDFQQIGWELRGTDLSKYAGLRIELSPVHDFDDFHVWLENPASFGDWGFNFAKDGVAYVFFNGQNRGWGEMKNPDPEEGFLIKFGGSITNIKKTVIKSIELIKKEDVPDASNLTLLDVPFGTQCWQSHIIGNEIIWAKGDAGGDAGWDLSGIDLSEYDRVRIEIESSTTNNFGMRLCDSNHENWHVFDQRVEPNVFEFNLSGEGASRIDDNGTDFDTSTGLKIIIQPWDRTKEEKTVVKSIQLLKGKKTPNKDIMIEDRQFGSVGWQSTAYESGLIEWEWNGEQRWPCAGWNIEGIDLSQYTKVHIEFEPEASTLPLQIVLYQREIDGGVIFDAVSNSFAEANLNGLYYNWKWENKGKWNPAKPIDEIWVRYNDISTNGEKSIIKSVTFLDDEIKPPLPDNLMLQDSQLSAVKDNAILDENYEINWLKSNWAQCGWRYENLEGDYLEIKVSSTDVPLRLRIRTNVNENEISYVDDGSHIFRINLKNKKQIDAKGNANAPEWEKSTKAINYKGGGEIVLEPASGVFKEGKKTVVEYIKIE